jgi:dTDP-4-dehydrorhamnose 3,5-epimerase
MKKTPIEQVEGAYTVCLDRFPDDRGLFQEVYSLDRYDGFQPSQINVSRSIGNVVRGMHVAPFAKLCMCMHGILWDVVADTRPDSPTYLGWYGIWLSPRWRSPNWPTQLFVPAGCAHGFLAAQDNTVLLYMQTDTYNPKVEREVNWRDPQLAIDWPEATEYILSDKDKEAPLLAALEEL